MAGVLVHCAAFLGFLLPVSHIFRNKLLASNSVFNSIFIKIHVVGDVRD